MDRTENFSPGYCEYIVDGFAGKNMIILRLAGVILGLVLTGAICSLLSIMPQVVFIWIVVVVFFEVMLFRLTKREFEYTAAMGELNVDVIYGKRFRRRLVTLRIADADRIFPVKGFDDEQIDRLGAQKILYASPKKSEFMYCLYTKDKGGKNSSTALLFSSCNKLNEAIKFYNRACFTERK